MKERTDANDIASEVINVILDEVVNTSPSECNDTANNDKVHAATDTIHDESVISINDSINTNTFGDPISDTIQASNPHLN